MKYHEVSFKASHNSYERDEPIHEQLKYFLNDPSRCGCRGLEFDIWRHSSATERFFTVSHNDPNGGYPFAYYLGLLLSYHLNHPQHDVIFVTIDIKSSHGSIDFFPDEIDNYISEYFHKELLFTPCALFVNKRLSLCENVIKSGWPEINSMKGSFVFCLSGTADWKNVYARSNIQSRLCFSDVDIDDDNDNIVVPARGDFIFFNMNIHSNNYSTWKKTLPLFLNKNLITRVYEADRESLWNKALHAGASILATNKVTGKPWAKVGNTPFIKRKIS
jgi:Phosphoinositide phospholipase C, Ca2+-dependent